MTRIALVDTESPFAYSDSLLDERGTGGTVLAVTLLARGLSQTAMVSIVQADPKHPSDDNHATLQSSARLSYRSASDFLRTTAAEHPDIIIHVRSRAGGLDLVTLRRTFPQAQIFHWQHITLWNHPWLKRAFNSGARAYTERTTQLLAACARLGVTVVGTSSFHVDNIRNFAQRWCASLPDIKYVYNPVEVGPVEVAPVEVRPVEGVKSAPQKYSPTQLIFFSNPQRGLNRAINLLTSLRRGGDDFRLLVLAPGYSQTRAQSVDGVEFIGELPRPELWKLVTQSLAVLYPNTDTPECFGYVFAESNALGTPVLTHDIGAAAEVLWPAPPQLVNCLDDGAVVSRIRAWRSGDRPTVSLKAGLSVEAVSNAWLTLFGGRTNRLH